MFRCFKLKVKQEPVSQPNQDKHNNHYFSDSNVVSHKSVEPF